MDDSDFSLLETMLYEPAHGIFLLDRHLARLNDAIVYFRHKYPHYFAEQLNIDQLCHQLDVAIDEHADARPARIRLLWSRAGEASIEVVPLPDPSSSHTNAMHGSAIARGAR
ncbi:hypothetical protein SYNPS1DRAFT_32069 [Syncephalis pseudoplumigaleata]|uniref:Aminotransferase n=1 Tax=Syncephalis pseudoplumigaleata TaxID=1712513 RepID=A0A4V1J0Q2_9FUNG|nr:hypothetical protein SYNPS1DRAFT_32069 [Syncephalis pseudoplumigaleata]|eukprot:RKP22349.1 hypothetical protein SYNPS1DRAFT_32069 [Syncephalis pseudoplumigaleata]